MLHWMAWQTKQAAGGTAENATTRLRRLVLPNAIFSKLLQPAEDDSLEAVHHVLAEPGLQPRPLHLHPSDFIHLWQPVLANWNIQVLKRRSQKSSIAYILFVEPTCGLGHGKAHQVMKNNHIQGPTKLHHQYVRYCPIVIFHDLANFTTINTIISM